MSVSWSYPRHLLYFREKKPWSLLFFFFFSFGSFYFHVFFAILFSDYQRRTRMDLDRPGRTQHQLASACVGSFINLVLPLLTVFFIWCWPSVRIYSEFFCSDFRALWSRWQGSVGWREQLFGFLGCLHLALCSIVLHLQAKLSLTWSV